jgi:translation initiation factor IF-2
MSDRNRTAFALQALGLAESFNVMLSGERIKGAVVYRVELSAPDGPSTAGGKQATQHVKLIPDGDGSGVIVAGSVNCAENWAELRSFEHLKRLHAQRWKGAAIPLNRVQYDELLGKLRAFFDDKGCAVRMAALPDLPAAALRGARNASANLVLALIVGLAAVASGAVVWFFTHR